MASARRMTAASDLTSVCAARTRPRPLARSAAWALARGPRSTSARTTSMPASTKRWANASPVPLPAPVTTATRPSKVSWSLQRPRCRRRRATRPRRDSPRHLVGHPQVEGLRRRLALVDRSRIGAGDLHRVRDDDGEGRLEVEGGADGAADLAEGLAPADLPRCVGRGVRRAAESALTGRARET